MRAQGGSSCVIFILTKTWHVFSQSISVQCHFLAVYSDAADGILNLAFDPVRQSSGLQLGAAQGIADKSIFVRYVTPIAAKLGRGQGALRFSLSDLGTAILKSSPQRRSENTQSVN